MTTAKELHNLSAAPIVNSLFSSKWSEDNQMSVITDVGVHILELLPSPLCTKRSLQLNRSYLYPADFLPAEKFTDQVNAHTLTWDREQVYTLLLESAISPKPNRANPVIPRIIDVAWSPKGLLQPGKCLLATLTSVGAVDIVIKSNRQWYSVHDLSLKWSKYLEDQVSISEDDNYAMYVAKARRFQATSIAWSDLQKNQGRYAYLAVSHRSSDLVFWKIDRIGDNNQEEIKPAKIVHKLELSSDVRVKIMQWINISPGQHYLFIGYHDGRIQCLKVRENLESSNLDIHIFEDYLLESDRISVSSIQLLEKRDNGLNIIVTKGNYLIYLCLDADGAVESNLFFRNPGFQISGITPMTNKEILTMSEDGKLTLVTILNDEMKAVSIKHEIGTNRLRCLGLSGSANKILFLTVTSPNSIYDHLVQREPTTIHFFFIDNEKNDPSTILLNEKVGQTLGNYWDCLEVLRMKMIDNPYYAQMIFTRNDLENMSSGLLRVTLWMNMIKQSCYKNETTVEQNTYNCNESKSLLFLHSAINVILLLSKKSNLSKKEADFVRLLKVYLEVYIGINDGDTVISRNIKQAIKELENVKANRSENCGLCGNKICDSSSTTSLCTTGHKFPRCALTLMQIISVKFRTCPICKLIFHLVVEGIWDEPKCLYCEVPLVYDSRICGIKFRGNIKNLSKASAALKGISGVDEEEGYGDNET